MASASPTTSQSSTNILLNVSTEEVNEVHVLRDAKRSKMDSSFDGDRDAKDMLKELLFKMNMLCCDIAEIKDSVKSVNEKVDRQEKILEVMRVDVDKNTKDVSDVKAVAAGCVDDVTANRKKLSDVDSQVKAIDKKLLDLEWKSIDNEARSRRHNVIFWDIPEKEHGSCGADCKVCKEDIEKVIREDLKLTERRLPTQRVHRFPPTRGGTTVIGKKANKPRGIIACFRDFGDKVEVLSAARRRGVKVFEDQPKAIRDARASLMDDVKAARNSDPPKKTAIAWPAKLYIDGKFVREGNVAEHARKNVSKR